MYHEEIAECESGRASAIGLDSGIKRTQCKVVHEGACAIAAYNYIPLPPQAPLEYLPILLVIVLVLFLCIVHASLNGLPIRTIESGTRA